jgi:hypothetical protein
MRRPTTLPTFAICCWLLAGCGWLLAGCGKGGPAARSPTASHLAAATPGAAISVRDAQAFARAVNLSAADVPGFTVRAGRDRKSPREQRAERAMLRCTGSQGSGADVARVSSKDFVFKRSVLDLGVSSEVGVAASASVAAGELAAIKSARIRGCFSRYLDEVFAGQRSAGARLAPVSIQAGTPPAPGASGSFGWRVTASLALRRGRFSFYMDILGFVYGPARVTLFSSGALLPFPAAVQQRLFGRLLARARAFRP